MHPLSPFFEKQHFAVLDGGLATELERRGHSLRDKLWSAKLLLEMPDAIQRVHTAFLQSGADIITTASYQATLPALIERGLDKMQSENILRLSYHLAEAAVNDFWAKYAFKLHSAKPLVAASIGPYGAYLADGSEYSGHYRLTKKELSDFHRPRFEVLYNSGARLFALETIPNEMEALALSELLDEFPDAYAWMSFCCKDGSSVSNGTPIMEAVLPAMDQDKIIAVGINCTPPQYISQLLIHMQGVSKPFIVYPNSGDSWNAAIHCWIESGSEWKLAEMANEWMNLGVKIIGGCCRVSPESISTLARQKWMNGSELGK